MLPVTLLLATCSLLAACQNPSAPADSDAGTQDPGTGDPGGGTAGLGAGAILRYIDRHGELWVGNNASFEIIDRKPGRDTVRIIRKAFHAVPVTAKEARAALAPTPGDT